LIVTGEAGVGKTTLIAALLKHLPTPAEVVIVERAQEMVLAEGFTRWPALPTNQQTPGLNFITRLQEAVQKMGPRCLVVDEIRGDEGEAFWLALHSPRPTQVILAQRGTSNPARLYSALKIALNKADPTLSAENINAAILARLPYVLSVQRPRRSFPPRLTLLAQWVIEGEGLTLAPLIRWPADQAPQEIDPPHSAQG
jgi:GTPase SAR1 family protein